MINCSLTNRRVKRQKKKLKGAAAQLIGTKKKKNDYL
jgi:hypothetical protein